MRTVFVFVVIALVLVQVKFAIGSAVNSKLYRSCGFFAGVLDFRAETKNRTCTHIEWNAVQRSLRINLASTLL